MKTQMICAALLLSTALLLPSASAEPDLAGDGTVILSLPAGVTTYPICVWWNIPPRTVTTPGVTVNQPPVYVKVDPTSWYVPGNYGKTCLYSVAPGISRDVALAGDEDGSSRAFAVALP